jgi:putative ABC transport system permease protein
MVYVPTAQVSDAMMKRLNKRFAATWIVRATNSTAEIADTLGRELRLEAGLPIARVRSLEEVVRTSMARNDFAVILLTVFAALSLVLAGTGMYALMNYSVEQRTQEIGIRLALGASPADVRNRVVLHGARLAGAGLVLGLGAAVILSRILDTLMFGLESWDPAVFVYVAALLTAVALAAAFIPARRATRISPLDSLRA